ncbi:MAG: hypothetical protein HWN65_16015 [Candidatus Helarchaeota archaeon]|nr:hypothetical protein [Candidatus Helarchaeota archaeon]
MFTSFGFVFISIGVNNNKNILNTITNLPPIDSTASTNPSSPVNLGDDVHKSENYNTTLQNYYYDTYSMDSADYHLIWLSEVNPVNQFDIVLFSDSGYLTPIGGSLPVSLQCNLIVYRPSSTQIMYPMVYTTSGTGDAYIEAESGDDISVGGSFSKSLNSTEVADMAEVDLSSSIEYNIHLSVPSGCDFDLFVFRTAPGSATPAEIYNSTSNVNGQDESIVFTPSTSDTYALVMVRVAGSGIGTVTAIALDFLNSDISELDSYTALEYSYYKTYLMDANDYQLLWLYETSPNTTFIPVVYSDPTYSTLAGNVTSASSDFHWIPCRPSSNQMLYPRVYAMIGTDNAYIQMQSARDWEVGWGSSTSLSSSDRGTLYQAYLSSSSEYEVNLDVFGPYNIDLHVFRMVAGAPTILDHHISASDVLGEGESIKFTPSSSDTYAFVLLLVNGSGSCFYNFEILEVSRIPSFEILPALLAFALIISLILFSPKRKKNASNNPIFPFFK